MAGKVAGLFFIHIVKYLFFLFNIKNIVYFYRNKQTEMTNERELKAKMMIAASLEHNIENGVWEGEDKEIAIEAAKAIHDDIVGLNWELEIKQTNRNEKLT